MGAIHFDAIIRSVGATGTRRRALGALLAGAIALLGRRSVVDVTAHDTLEQCKKIKVKKKRKKCVKKAKNHSAQHANEAGGSGGGGSGGGGPGGGTGSTGCVVPYTPDSEEQAFLGLINAYRNENGAASLTLQCQLGAAAEQHAQSMAILNRMYHNPDVRAYLLLFGYAATSWGENIAAGHETASQVFAAWKRSPTHNTNMLHAAFTEIGIGRAFSTISGWYWSTELGSR